MSLWSLRFAPSMTTLSGMPLPSVSTERLTPRLPRSVGLRPVFSPTQRGLPHSPIECQPGPVDAAERVVGQQAVAPERLEHPGLRPFLETPMAEDDEQMLVRFSAFHWQPVRSTKKIAS